MGYLRTCIAALLIWIAACDGMRRRPITEREFWSRYLNGIDDKSFSLKLDARRALGGGAALAALSTSSDRLVESLTLAGYALTPASDLEVALVLSRADNAAGSAGMPEWFVVPAGKQSLWATSQRGSVQVTVLAVPEAKTAFFVAVGERL